MNEKRQSSREKTLWKVNMIENNQEKFIGYLMDLSEGGAKFYIGKDKGKELVKVFKVKIKPPYDINLEKRILSVEKVWERETHFIEMGLHFIISDDSEMDYISSLLKAFQNDKKINVETQILF